MVWCDDLCEYYGVTPEEAEILGTRAKGRKPDLPESDTCEAVSGMTFEDLWDMKPRESLQSKMDFYKDIGAWQVFRQMVYRRGFNYGRFFNPYLKDNSVVLEYGCGIAPFTHWVTQTKDVSNMKFVLVDVAGEHLEFAKWRLNKAGVECEVHEITADYSNPKFSCNFDIVCIMDVYEHLPNPYDVTQNIINHSNKGSIMVETWVHSPDDSGHGPNLREAEIERKKTMKLIDEHYKLAKKGSIRVRRFRD